MGAIFAPVAITGVHGVWYSGAIIRNASAELQGVATDERRASRPGLA
jgi:hypothetical protein